MHQVYSIRKGLLMKNRSVRKYEQKTPMTLPERKALRKWVSAGNSVHDNVYHAIDDETGRTLDFLDVYRRQAEFRQDGLPWNDSRFHPQTVQNLRQEIRELNDILFCMWMFLDQEDLVYEAREYIRHIADNNPYSVIDANRALGTDRPFR